MPTLAELLLAFAAFYPVVTASLWVAGGILFRILDEEQELRMPAGGWPGVTILIPAYNEERVIATCVRAALAVDYAPLEVIVLDDGSTDASEAAALEAAGGDPRCRVLRDPVNRGKADRLNDGLREATHELVAVTDADTHLHAEALKLLVARISRSPAVAAVAGSAHVTNRGTLMSALQVLEVASTIGLIRRTQALTGRVGVVAGVLGLFHRDRVVAVGGYDRRMATEDIDLSWKLLLAGWTTAYEPRALVGMQVPPTLRALWEQRKRWARGQGEVLNSHLREVTRWRNRRLWLLSFEAVASLLWIVVVVASLVLLALGHVVHGRDHFVEYAFAWGIAIAVVATGQVVVALWLERAYDPTAPRAFLLGALYPLAYWIVGAAAAIRSQTVGLVRGPRGRVVWELPREAV